MKSKICINCGVTFTSTSLKGGARLIKYCSDTCRKQGYKKNRQKAKKKYYQKKKSQTIIKCRWCGEEFTSTYNKKYCCHTCRRESTRERKLRYQQKYRVRGVSDKQKYFENLGNSNLREHRKVNFKDEERLIKAEKRRLHL